MESYDIAQICLNGHVIASTAGSSPQFRKKRCDECGEKTIMNCPHCNEPIKGYYHVPGFLDTKMHYDIPRFCENCGKPYPWIKSKIESAFEIIDFIDSLSDAEKIDFKVTIQELIKETPKIAVAKVKFKKYRQKIDSDISDGLNDVLVDTLNEKLKNELL